MITSCNLLHFQVLYCRQVCDSLRLTGFRCRTNPVLTSSMTDGEEVLYVGMAGRDGKGSLRRRLRDHSSGQIVNMFAQYLFLGRVQFLGLEPLRHPPLPKRRVELISENDVHFALRSQRTALPPDC